MDTTEIVTQLSNMRFLLWNAFIDLPLLARWFIGIILGLTLLFLFARATFVTTNGPTVLTSIGILGTFLGIALGLHAFNQSDIATSVVDLIANLKTAFWSSIFGLGGALILKLKHMLQLRAFHQDTDAKYTGATVDDLAELLERLNHSLVGQDSETLLSQIKMHRSDNNDRLAQLRTSIDNWVKEAAEQNAKAFIEALENVIREFNEKISDQFGENFKELNKAVGQILIWQERYRGQMEEMIEQQASSAANLTTISKSVTEISSQIQDFDDISRNMAKAHESLNGELRALDAGLAALADMGDKAKESIPMIKEELGDVVNTFEGIAERIRTRTEEIEKALQEALSESIMSLGEQLGALSEKFVEDYRPLTEQLRRMVHELGSIR